MQLQHETTDLFVGNILLINFRIKRHLQIIAIAD